jgi:hypothetical protein
MAVTVAWKHYIAIAHSRAIVGAVINRQKTVTIGIYLMWITLAAQIKPSFASFLLSFEVYSGIQHNARK